ncbi:MAG: zinc ribbon domain-containing protein [Anaerolineales bacterium]|nr:zinc ribbon domain-containing protein [Anaerolineales bacterium]
MPFYDYHCHACGKNVRIFLSYAEYDTAVATCPHCQSDQLKRRLSRITIAKSEDARMDSLLDDPSLANLDEDDPRAMGKFMRRMSQETGEDMGEEFNEVVERLEKGESPDSIEQSMPDLGNDIS